METPRKFITAKLSIRKPGSSSVLIICDLFNSHAIINDLCITKSPTSNLWKFADDTSVSEVIPKDGVSSLPDKVDEVNKWSNDNKFQLNPGKCKELRINFTTQPFTEEPLNINEKPFEIVKSAKVLGMIVTNDLKWNKHVSNTVEKASKRLYLLRQLKRAEVETRSLYKFYTACIRSVVEYACQVFHSRLPNYTYQWKLKVFRSVHYGLSTRTRLTSKH